MLRKIHNNQGQSIFGEYVLVFFIVIAVMSSMTIYLRRLMQAKIRDANWGMIDTISNRVGNLYSGQNIFRQYEPYYRNSLSFTTRDVRDTTRVTAVPGFSSGIFSKEFNETTSTQGTTITLPPQDAD